MKEATCEVLGLAAEFVEARTVPFFDFQVPAGFPSPADDYLEKELNLQDLLVENAAATFLVRVRGDSMRGTGIFDGDLVVVDRSVTPVSGKIIVAVLDGELTVKRLVYRGGRCFLESANPAFPPIEVTDFSDNAVWGVVTRCLHIPE